MFASLEIRRGILIPFLIVAGEIVQFQLVQSMEADQLAIRSMTIRD